MKVIAILAALAAGAPLAAAQPHEEVPQAQTQPHHDVPMGRTSYTQANTPKPADGWVQLATPTPARYGREFFVVDKDLGPLGQLKIGASDGAVHVDHVTVYFANGNHEDYKVARTLDSGRSAVVDLHQTGTIDHVVVVTSRHSPGAYELYGSSLAGGASR